jgi:hypothetical protein
MKRQQMRQHDSTGFAVTVPRDRHGYGLVKRVIRVDQTLAAGGRRKGDIVEEIVGRSGEIEFIQYQTGSNRPPIWPKLNKLISPGDIAVFMSRWGVIDFSPAARSDYVASAESVVGLVRRLKYLATFAESDDVEGFLGALKDRTVFHGTLRLQTNGTAGRLVGQATSLAQFLVLEMWLDFGGEQQSRGGIKACAWCNQPFLAGGRRKSTSLRADAEYCQKSCRNAASRARGKCRAAP